jgi:cytochrome P450
LAATCDGNFPGANHDPEVFDDPDTFVIDRAQNRHVSFGAGIHRCAGSNLARLEVDLALRTFVDRIGHFTVQTPSEVAWAGGQVHGPRILPITF